jgi:hypothetical protein
MAPEVKPAKNSKLPKLPENYFEPAGKGGWPPISTWIKEGQGNQTERPQQNKFCWGKGFEVLDSRH